MGGGAAPLPRSRECWAVSWLAGSHQAEKEGKTTALGPSPTHHLFLLGPWDNKGFYRQRFSVNVMTGTLTLNLNEGKCYVPRENSMLLVSRPTSQFFLNCYCIFNFHKKFLKICFLSCYISTQIISSIFLVGPQSLKYLIPGSLQNELADPCSKWERTRTARKERRKWTRWLGPSR